MKLISLNTWGGKIYQPLMAFIKKNAGDTDIFCFQEIFSTESKTNSIKGYQANLYAEISKILINHQGYFAPSLRNYLIGNRLTIEKVNFGLDFGLAIFVKKQLSVNLSGDFFVYGKRFVVNPQDQNSLPRNFQYVMFKKTGKKFTVCNLHGIWLKEGKEDTTSRLEQSKQINNFLNKQKGKKILCGDFNLDINTESIKILEKDLRNLIKDHSIQTTRNSHFPGSEKFADYIFISKEIKVKSFEVPQIEISDHLPMVLEFE